MSAPRRRSALDTRVLAELLRRCLVPECAHKADQEVCSTCDTDDAPECPRCHETMSLDLCSDRPTEGEVGVCNSCAQDVLAELAALVLGANDSQQRTQGPTGEPVAAESTGPTEEPAAQPPPGAGTGEQHSSGEDPGGRATGPQGQANDVEAGAALQAYCEANGLELTEKAFALSSPAELADARVHLFTGFRRPDVLVACKQTDVQNSSPTVDDVTCPDCLTALVVTP